MLVEVPLPLCVGLGFEILTTYGALTGFTPMQENKAMCSPKVRRSFWVLLGMSIEEGKEPLKPMAETTPQTPPDIFLVPEIRESIPKIVGMIEWYYKDRSKSNLKITYVFVALLAGLTVGAFTLAFWKIISGETVIFLIGSLFGYVFAFLQRYLGPSS